MSTSNLEALLRKHWNVHCITLSTAGKTDT